jgi:hypothetical protein
MSRAYRMNITVNDARLDRHQSIREMIQTEWKLDDWSVTNGEIYAEGESCLVGGETEEEFADRVTKAIWRANAAYCPVMVMAICLEELPHETHVRDQEDFERLVTDFELSSDADVNLPTEATSSAAVVSNIAQSPREFAYRLSLDGDLFRRQRGLLLRLASAASEGRPLEMTTQDVEHLEGLIGLCDSLADQAHDEHGIDCLLTNDDEASASETPSPTTADVESELEKLGDDDSEADDEGGVVETEPLDVEKLACVKINAPHWFQRPDFRVWLNQNEMERARDRLATWHTGGEPRENSDTFITYNGGEVSDYQDLPEDVLDAIDTACRERGVNWAVIWLTNVG